MPEPTPTSSLGHTVTWPSPQRQAAFGQWLAPWVEVHGLQPDTLRAASADASFRRYLRIDASRLEGASSLIVMDAPPPQEQVQPYVNLASHMQAAGLRGPQVLAVDEVHGFVLLSDLGPEVLLGRLQQCGPEEADTWMRRVARRLVDWQQAMAPVALPPFDEALLQRELDLFPEWCVRTHFGLTWTEAQQQAWQGLCQRLIHSALAQPTVAVHRDWMPRNLMVVGDDLAILDFQDAVRGPITYDAASMLRDAFWSWEEEQEIDWAVRYWQDARKAGLAVHDDFGDFWRALEWMGLQRHLKVLGIFCRLQHRDGKPKYAQDLPRFFAYATRVALRYRELAPLLPLIEPLSGFERPTAFSMR